ncbi:MAG: hypothetical protein WBA77_19950 [Microcoleaceae cyanobacterium]
MVNLTTASRRKQLEKLWVKSSKNPQKFNRIRIGLHQFFQYFFQALIDGEQPRVWQVSHRGKSDWSGYDPVSGCRVSGLSEAEMQAWLEQRYNR